MWSKNCSCKSCSKAKAICPVSFGLAWGIVFGLSMLGFAWIAWISGYGMSVVMHHAAFISGYGASFGGGIIGGLWGLLEGFLLGFFIALFYDFISCCCCRFSCCKKEAGTCGCGADKSHCQCNVGANKMDK